MKAVCEISASCPGLVSSSCPRLLLGNFRCCNVRFGSFRGFRRKSLCYNARHLSVKHAAIAGGRGNRDRSFDRELSPEEPFWLVLIKELIWSLRSMFSFLCEQPRQLKYIEWPSFQNTLKTATLTLVLVALLLVALTSVDTALSYLSRWLLRKT